MKLEPFSLLLLIVVLCGCCLAAGRDFDIRKTFKDLKQFKKYVKSKRNILICFTRKKDDLDRKFAKMIESAADEIKSEGAITLIECKEESQKLCKQLKIEPSPFVLKHYKDGAFHKDYDRRLTKKALVNFMRDPTGDLPWEEDDSSKDVVHLMNEKALSKLLEKPTAILIMFYVPWCGFCKKLKPEYAEAASALRKKFTLAAFDVNRPENSHIRSMFNITGFPTLLYFAAGREDLYQSTHRYDGARTKQNIIDFMNDPDAEMERAAEEKPAAGAVAAKWSETPSEVVHLTDDAFADFEQSQLSALVMFYAPWCSHCNRLKPHYEFAAAELKSRRIEAVLGAVDATEATALASRFAIKAYPTLKYFRDGRFAYDVNLYDNRSIIEFMMNPRQQLAAANVPPSLPSVAEQGWDDVTKSNVVHLTDSDFGAWTRKKKFVLAIFYAPWCGHCKNAKPEFAKAATHFKDDIKRNFAAVDCTLESSKKICSQFDVKGYPTILLLKYGQAVRKYSGGRTETGFIEFMATQDSYLYSIINNDIESLFQYAKYVLVLFSDADCRERGDCNRIEGDFVKLAKKLEVNRNPSIVQFASIESGLNRQLIADFKVTHYPTVILIDGSNRKRPQSVSKFDYSSLKKLLDPVYAKAAQVAKDEL